MNQNFKTKKNDLTHYLNLIEKELKSWIKWSEGNIRMPWHEGIPPAVNRCTGRLYGGENLWLLWRKCQENNYPKNHWATFYQWQRLGARIPGGQSGTLVRLYIPHNAANQLAFADDDFKREVQDPDGYFVRYYYVFNAAQVSNFFSDNPDQTNLFNSPVSPYDLMNKMIEGSRAKIVHGGDRAYYDPGVDFIRMPYKASYLDNQARSGVDAYYSVLLQELIHWTGHFSRMDRFSQNNAYGQPGQAFEKLIAELGGAMLSSYFHNHVESRLENSRYIDAWIKILNHDIRYLYYAQNQALAAVTWLFRSTEIFDWIIQQSFFQPLSNQQRDDLDILLNEE
jgi:antirestriction protein ArdC